MRVPHAGPSLPLQRAVTGAPPAGSAGHCRLHRLHIHQPQVSLAVRDVCSCPAGRIPVCDHTLGRVSQEICDPYASVLTVMRRDGRSDDILWESHLLVAEGIDQVLECVVGGRSRALKNR